MDKFFDITLQGIINAAVASAGLIAAVFAWKKWRQELREKAVTSAIDSDTKRDEILLVSYKNLLERIDKADESTARAWQEVDRAKAETEKVRNEKHAIHDQWHADIWRKENEDHEREIAHKEEIAELMRKHKDELAKVRKTCDDEVKAMTEEIRLLNEKIETLQRTIDAK